MNIVNCSPRLEFENDNSKKIQMTWQFKMLLLIFVLKDGSFYAQLHTVHSKQFLIVMFFFATSTENYLFRTKSLL